MIVRSSRTCVKSPGARRERAAPGAGVTRENSVICRMQVWSLAKACRRRLRDTHQRALAHERHASELAEMHSRPSWRC